MALRRKPSFLADIISRRESVFRAHPPRIWLMAERRIVRIPFFKTLKVLVVVGAVSFLVLGHVAAPTTPTLAAASGSADERAALEAQLKDLENQIGQYQDQIVSYQKQGGTLKGEINQLNAKIAKINLQIKAVNITLTELGQKITDTTSKIKDIETAIGESKSSLGTILKTIYQSDRASMVEILLKSRSFSDFFSDVQSLTVLQDSLRAQIAQITDLRNQLQDEQDQLRVAQADAATVRDYQQSQKAVTEQLKGEKNNLLAVTKGQESKYQTLLTQTKQTAAQIRNRIFELLGGGELSFEAAYQLAKIAGDATGVRPAFLLAILNRESALGQNVGKCSYTKAMNPNLKRQSDGSLKSDVDIFLNLVSTLNLGSPDSLLVSCANADGAFGGAMGPAQFLPSTWEIFADAIARITGHNPASPWNNADAFTAAALYLKNAGAIASERTAAAKYYCGGNWNRYVCKSVYGQRVVEQAAQFQQDIDTILN